MVIPTLMALARKRPGRALQVLGVVALAAAVNANAAVVTIAADRDSTLIEDATGALSNGAGDRLFTGETLQFGSRRALVHFDLSAIPAGSAVTSALLTLDMDMTRAGPAPVGLHRLLADWGEGGSAASGGGGAAAQAGDATWLHRFYPSVLWSSAGSDFSAVPGAVTAVVAAGTYEWGSTPALIAHVQSWVDDPAANFGWILISDETVRSAKSYFSREAGSDGPRLTIVYAPIPEPATYAFLAAGLAVFAIAVPRARRWQRR